jgi:hypothetical protein
MSQIIIYRYLIILDFKGIHVILGMDWLRKHKVFIYCAKKVVKLNLKDGKELKCEAEPLVTAREQPTTSR